MPLRGGSRDLKAHGVLGGVHLEVSDAHLPESSLERLAPPRPARLAWVSPPDIARDQVADAPRCDRDSVTSLN